MDDGCRKELKEITDSKTVRVKERLKKTYEPLDSPLDMELVDRCELSFSLSPNKIRHLFFFYCLMMSSTGPAGLEFFFLKRRSRDAVSPRPTDDRLLGLPQA